MKIAGSGPVMLGYRGKDSSAHRKEGNNRSQDL
jgi:hypothetical protein